MYLVLSPSFHILPGQRDFIHSSALKALIWKTSGLERGAEALVHRIHSPSFTPNRCNRPLQLFRPEACGGAPEAPPPRASWAAARCKVRCPPVSGFKTFLIRNIL